jgi:hypothetical protein
MGVGTALVASAVIGAATSAYAGKQTRDAAKEAEAEQRRAAEEAKAEQERIARETGPEQDAATIDFGTNKKGKTIGSTNDFLVPKSTSSTAGLTTGSGTGLGFGI